MASSNMCSGCGRVFPTPELEAHVLRYAGEEDAAVDGGSDDA